MIELREFVDNDVNSIAICANNINVSRYMASRMPYPYTKDNAKWWIEFGSKEQGLNYAIDLGGNCIGVDPQKGLILQLETGGVRFFDAAHTSIAK